MYLYFLHSKSFAHAVNISEHILQDIDYFIFAVFDQIVEVTNIAENHANLSGIVGDEILLDLKSVNSLQNKFRHQHGQLFFAFLDILPQSRFGEEVFLDQFVALK